MRVAIYARVSTSEQTTNAQLSDLHKEAAAKHWVVTEFLETGSGADRNRPQLQALMNGVREGRFDLVAVWKFDRIARSTSHLLEIATELSDRGVDLYSHQEAIDTTSPMGQFVFTILAAVAQLERDIIRERVKAGMRAAKEAGKQIGRVQSVEIDQEAAVRLVNAKGLRAAARHLGVSHTTLHRRIKNRPEKA